MQKHPDYIYIALTREQLDDLTKLVIETTDYDDQGSYWYDIHQELITAEKDN